MPHQFALYDLPLAFIRQFQPVAAFPHERGLQRYLFDEIGLRYYRAMSTVPIQATAVWSVTAGIHHDRPELVFGQEPNAAGYVVVQCGADSASPTHWLLPRRLSLRQRIRKSTLECILTELRAGPNVVPSEVLTLLESRCTDEAWLAAPPARRRRRLGMDSAIVLRASPRAESSLQENPRTRDHAASKTNTEKG